MILIKSTPSLISKFSEFMAKKGKQPRASKQQDAVSAGWFLSTDDKWTKPYFDPKDLHSVDRNIFG